MLECTYICLAKSYILDVVVIIGMINPQIDLQVISEYFVVTGEIGRNVINENDAEDRA